MFLLVSSLLFAIMGLLVKVVSQNVPGPEVVFFRGVLPALCLLPALQAAPRDVLRRNAAVLLLRGLLGGIAVVLYFYAIARIPYADACMLNNTAPIFATVFSAVFLREPAPRSIYAALPLALLGVGCIVKPFSGGTPAHWEGYACGLLSGVFSGGAYTAVRQATRECGSSVVVGVFSWVTTLMILPFLPAAWRAPGVTDTSMLLGIGALAMLAQLFMTAGYRDTATSRASTLTLATVLFAALLGAAVLHEIPDRLQVSGMALVFLALFWLTREVDSPPEPQ